MHGANGYEEKANEIKEMVEFKGYYKIYRIKKHDFGRLTIIHTLKEIK